MRSVPGLADDPIAAPIAPVGSGPRAGALAAAAGQGHPGPQSSARRRADEAVLVQVALPSEPAHALSPGGGSRTCFATSRCRGPGSCLGPDDARLEDSLGDIGLKGP